MFGSVERKAGKRIKVAFLEVGSRGFKQQGKNFYLFVE
jgi:hypothetical protein